MTDARKNLPFGFGELEAKLRRIFIDEPKVFIKQAREKMRDMPRTNFVLGCNFADQGLWHDALFRFRLALYFRPGYPEALYNIAYCHYQLGHTAKAEQLLKKVLQETPAHEDAIFLLASIDPEALPPSQRPQVMPKTMIVNFFSALAGTYNQSEAKNQYRGGVAVADIVKPLLPGGAITVTDLGCGTGIASIPYRVTAAKIVGVDFTPAMVTQARLEGTTEKKLLDEVIESDIAAPGATLPAEPADLVLVVNVVQFIGKLDGAVANASQAVKEGGLVALTIEPYNQPQGFGMVTKSGRFGHSEQYVSQLASAAGLVPVKSAMVTLYPSTSAQLLIYRKER